MARPQKPIDLKLLEDLARIQCTDEEMASILGFTREGLRKRKQRQPELVGVIEKGKEAGRCSAHSPNQARNGAPRGLQCRARERGGGGRAALVSPRRDRPPDEEPGLRGWP